MAYNPNLYMPYGQQSYPMPTYQQPQMQQVPQAPQPFDLIIAVSGRNGAEAFQMPPNSRVVLFDEKQDIMYRVTTDGAGYKTIMDFDFFPRKHGQEQQVAEPADYVPRSEFDALTEKVGNISESIGSIAAQVAGLGQKPTRTTRKAAADE